MILTTTFVCFCLASAFNYFRTRRQRSLIKNLKGPFTWPLMGAMHKLLFLTPKNFFQRSTEYLTKYGTFSRCWVFHRLFIPLADLELSRQLLENDTHLETGYELMKDWLAGGVLMCQSEQWQKRHGLISGLFDKGNLVGLMDLSRHQAEQLLQKLAEQEDQKVFDIWNTVSPIVLDLMVMTTCGAKPSEEYSKNLKDLSELYRKRFMSLQSANRFNYWLSSPFMRKRQNRLIKRLNEEHMNLMASHQSQKQLKVGDGLDMYQFRPMPLKNHESLLEILLKSKDPQLTGEEICAEINTCNYLGYLLCSSSLCFCLVTIARNPSVQQKCLEELNLAQIKDQGWDLEKLPYLEAVLQETMRLYPPQVIVGRQLKKDFPYTHSIVGDAELPFGSEIYINLYELQRNEERYPNANHFDAQRFLDSPPELLSYSLGPRCCPARKFSMQLLKTLLAPILTNFELLPYGDEVRLDLQLVLGSSNGFQLALKPR
ncbi:probable cytochrome P450 316a1 [Drosophila sechellia]|uniref:GM14851 n=1 Tax=Drosophila sechellia TaxID=7238 RepID=B4HV80_DROSE|nr:probable cytochrome P450 316a1 [Drosophila sechellia]EDW50851.1 GM14851 [Drosophila sechellia]